LIFHDDLLGRKALSHTRSKIYHLFFSIQITVLLYVLRSFFLLVCVFYGNKCQQHASSLVICHIILFFSFFFSKHVQWERIMCAVHIVPWKSFDSEAVNRWYIHRWVMMMMHLKTNINKIIVLHLSLTFRYLVHWLLIFTKLSLLFISNLFVFHIFQQRLFVNRNYISIIVKTLFFF